MSVLKILEQKDFFGKAGGRHANDPRGQGHPGWWHAWKAAWTPMVALSTPSRLVAHLSDGRDQDPRARGQRVPVGTRDGVLGDQRPADRDTDGARP